MNGIDLAQSLKKFHQNQFAYKTKKKGSHSILSSQVAQRSRIILNTTTDNSNGKVILFFLKVLNMFKLNMIIRKKDE